MAENHGAPEAGNSPGPESEVVEGLRFSKEQAAQRVRNWTVQNVSRVDRRRCMKDSREIRV